MFDLDHLKFVFNSLNIPLLRYVKQEASDEASEEDLWLMNWINNSIIDALIGIGIFAVQNYMFFFIFTFGAHQGLFYWMIYEYKNGKTYLEPWEYYRNWTLIKEEQGWFYLFEMLFETPFPYTEPDIPFLVNSIEGASVWNMEVFAISMWIWVVIAIVLEFIFWPTVLYLLY